MVSLLQPQHFINGCLFVELHDHRLAPVVTQRLRLRYHNQSLTEDLAHFGTSPETRLVWSQDTALCLEARVLPFVHEPICLDPNPKVFQKACELNYHRQMYSLPMKRKKVDQVAEPAIKQDVHDLFMLMDNGEAREFYSRFSQLNFVEEWRKQQKLANDEALVGLGDKNKIKLNKTPTGYTHRKLLAYNINRRIVRTLRFENVISSRKFFHILNVYDAGNQEFEAVLRWGDVEGTANQGGTLKFPLGVGKSAVDLFIGHFKALYGMTHTFIVDSAADTAKTT